MEIVIADPDRDSRDSLAALLKKLYPTARVTGFADPMFLVQYCLNQRPDAVFTEIAMPGPMDGPTLVAMLHKRYPEIKCYFVTGSEEYRQVAASLNTDGYLLKPLEEARLRATMDRGRDGA